MTTISNSDSFSKWVVYQRETGFILRTERLISGQPTFDPEFEGIHKIADVSVLKIRLRNERDDPPGVGYLTRKRAGSYIPPNEYTSNASWCVLRPRVLRSGDTDLKFPSVTSGPLIPTHSTAIDGPADIQAKRNYYASLGRLSSAQAGISLIEIKQTLGMIGNTVVTIARIIAALKKGRFDKAIDALADHGVSIPKHKRYLLRNRNKNTKISKSQWISNAWLELQFGWKPLLADVYDIADTTANIMNGDYFPTVSISGHGSESLAISDTAVSIYGYEDVRGSGSRHVAYTSLFHIDNGGIAFLKAFGLTDPLSIAWEVVPFSFVVDWFIPIGDWIESLTAFDNLNHMHTVKSVRNTGSQTYFLKEDQNGPVTGCGVDQSFSTFRRTIESNPPQYPFGPSSILDILDGWHLVTSLALLQQKFGR